MTEFEKAMEIAAKEVEGTDGFDFAAGAKWALMYILTHGIDIHCENPGYSVIINKLEE